MHIKAMLPASGERGLTPWEMTQRVDKALNSPMFRGGITQGVRDKACSALFIDDIRRYLLGGLLPQRDADPPKYFKGCLDALVATRYTTRHDTHDTRHARHATRTTRDTR